MAVLNSLNSIPWRRTGVDVQTLVLLTSVLVGGECSSDGEEINGI
jgi:hypothetical protein